MVHDAILTSNVTGTTGRVGSVISIGVVRSAKFHDPWQFSEQQVENPLIFIRKSGVLDLIFGVLDYLFPGSRWVFSGFSANKNGFSTLVLRIRVHKLWYVPQ